MVIGSDGLWDMMTPMQVKIFLFSFHICIVIFALKILKDYITQGADLKNNQTIKQLNNYISANRKVEKKNTCFLFVQIKLINCFVVWLFLKSAPRMRHGKKKLKNSLMERYRR